LTLLKSSSTKNANSLGFQVSVSKTFNISTHLLWEFILSEKGLQEWLGINNADEFEIQNQFVSTKGIIVKLTVFVTDCHLRFKWKPIDFEKPTTVELRITNAKGKAKAIFHITGFYKIEQKEILRNYWKKIILKINNIVTNITT
jgi:activator of HSP90 ATPase